MRIICSWCKKFLDEKKPFDDKSVSHAKCADCLERQEQEAKKDVADETPAEMAHRLDRITSILAEGVLKLIEERQLEKK